jgi:translation initiation factor IF-3
VSFREETVSKKVIIELEPSLSSCIETLAKREYEKALSTILKTGTEDEELSERLEVLRLFLESTDFGTLRSQYEKYLEKGKKVKFRIYSTKGKVSYKLVIQTQ